MAFLGAPVLAQSGKGALSFLDVPDPAPLPKPPLLSHLLFENPLPVTLVLVVLGLVLYVVLNARARFKQGLILAGACVLMAGGVWILAAIVQTDQEKMRQTARDLVDAVTRVDVGTVDRLLTSDARLSGVPMLGEMGKPAILSAISGNLGPGGGYEVAEHSIQEMQSVIDGPLSGRVQLRVRVEVRQMGYPNVSWWGLGLARGTDGTWKVVGIRALAIRGVS